MCHLMSFNTFTVLCNYCLYVAPKHFNHPQRNLMPIKKSLPVLLPHPSLWESVISLDWSSRKHIALAVYPYEGMSFSHRGMKF